MKPRRQQLEKKLVCLSSPPLLLDTTQRENLHFGSINVKCKSCSPSPGPHVCLLGLFFLGVCSAEWLRLGQLTSTSSELVCDLLFWAEGSGEKKTTKFTISYKQKAENTEVDLKAAQRLTMRHALGVLDRIMNDFLSYLLQARCQQRSLQKAKSISHQLNTNTYTSKDTE